MRTYPYYLIVNGDMTQNIASSAQKIDYTIFSSVQATYTGNFPQGTLSLFGSNDGNRFVTVKNSSVQLDGTTGITMWNFWGSEGFLYMQCGFLATSASSGTLTVLLNSKGA